MEENNLEGTEMMSFFEMLMEIPVWIVMTYYFILWLISMGVLYIYIKYIK